MIFRKYTLALILLMFMTQSFAQSIYQQKDFFSTIFNNGLFADPYMTGDNPAYLENDGRDQLLEVETSYFDEDGDFRSFIEPGNERMYQLLFSGKKILDDNQIFKGSFAVQRREFREWNWLANRNYDTGNPFLIGDSTSGRTRYNGIIMKAEYSGNITECLTTGIALEYGVDEGLKEVAPRPTSDHRDITGVLGFRYKVLPSLSIGVTGKAYDYHEQIDFREDEGAIYDETILLKFRGYDYPFVLFKKVETRYAYHNGYFGGFDAVWNPANNMTISANVSNGLEQIVVKEDANNPESAGFWKNEVFSAKLAARYNPSDDLSIGMLYSFNSENNWAKHPKFKVIYSEQEKPAHRVSSGLEWKVSKQSQIGLEASFGLGSDDFSDYYSNIHYAFDKTDLGAALGYKQQWTECFSTFAGYGFTNVTVSNDEITYSQTESTEYFTNARLQDILFVAQSYSKHSLHLSSQVNTKFPGIVILSFDYDYLKPEEKTQFLFDERSFYNVSLELRINVY